MKILSRQFISILFTRITSSIAFYPTLIAFIFTIAAVFILKWEDNELTNILLDKFPFLVINNADTARSILSTLIGGIISLTVFSFSMVMVLLNQASSNFSPRILPGLISDKRNQIVLGIYLGTIIYNILVLISILPDGDKYTLNGFSILLGIIFGIISLSLFVFFIHSISTSIQVNNILKAIFEKTKNTLVQSYQDLKNNTLEYNVDFHQVTYIRLPHSGYLDKLNTPDLLNWSKENNLDIEVLCYEGEFILPNRNIAKVNGLLENISLLEIASKFTLSPNPNPNNNYLLGLKQITEVGIKAMSPGINDPGTALITLDYLTELLALRMKISSHTFLVTDDKQFSVCLRTMPFGTILQQISATYREYCKHDILLVHKMILMYKYLLQQESKENAYYNVILDELTKLKEDVMVNTQNAIDKKSLLVAIERAVKQR